MDENEHPTGTEADLPQDEPSGTDCEAIREELEALNDRHLRLAADFDNYKKRVAKETQQRINASIADFAGDVLVVIDNLERARGAEAGARSEGLDQICKLALNLLERRGIRPIECLNRPFDPSYHEAIAYLPSEQKEGTIIDEVEKGYIMHDSVIRCAKVAVSRGKSEDKQNGF